MKTFLPDSTHIQSLVNISDNYQTLPEVYAMNILIHEGVFIYDEPVYFPDYFKSISAFGERETTFDEENILKVFPNPAGTYFIVEHNLKQYKGVFKLIVSDMHGKTIDEHYLDSEQNQQLIPTLIYPSGIYLIQLYVNGILQETEKLSISK